MVAMMKLIADSFQPKAVSMVTSDNGTQLGTIKYYPYGDCRNSQGDLGTDKLFTGQRLDDTGLYYYGARYYDPTIGRFISPDTVVQNFANPQSLNRYSYVFNNPLKYTDPSGLIVDIGEFGDVDYVGDLLEAIFNEGIEPPPGSYVEKIMQMYLGWEEVRSEAPEVADYLENAEEHIVMDIGLMKNQSHAAETSALINGRINITLSETAVATWGQNHPGETIRYIAALQAHEAIHGVARVADPYTFRNSIFEESLGFMTANCVAERTGLSGRWSETGSLTPMDIMSINPGRLESLGSTRESWISIKSL
ncbi:MAG: RHS repeat-associated core domain-containing protein, partial [Chloroflexota bacterium]